MEHMDEIRGCVIAAILVALFLAFVAQLFGTGSGLAGFFSGFIGSIGGM